MSKRHIKKIIKHLNLAQANYGSCFGSADEWSSTSTRGEIISINPATGDPTASVYNASHEDLEQVIACAKEAQLAWREVPAPQRGDIIRQIGERLRQHKDDLGSLISIETGKIKQEGDGEVQEMIDMADFAVGQSRMLYGNTMHSERPRHRMYEQWHPLGVVGVITAFNFPMAVWSWNAFIAAIAGNTVIWKPSSKTPLCALAVQHLCNQVMKENNMPGIFSLFISSDNALATQLVEDQRIALVSFTGSTPVGRDVAARVANRLGRSLLELSGNNAIIVDESADLSIALPGIVFSAVGTAGQRCTSARRLIVHEAIYDTVVNKLKTIYATIKIGDPLDPKNLMGPLIDEAAACAFEQSIESAQQSGATLLYGGKRLSVCYVEPTLMAADNNIETVQNETFAPILYIMKAANIEEAIAMQNASHHGLSSSLFTRDHQRAERFLSTLGSDCGIANINIGTSGAEIGGAFGGEKQTGGGREAGSDAWKAYMRRQTNTINWGSSLPLSQGIEFDV